MSNYSNVLKKISDNVSTRHPLTFLFPIFIRVCSTPTMSHPRRHPAGMRYSFPRLMMSLMQCFPNLRRKMLLYNPNNSLIHCHRRNSQVLLRPIMDAKHSPPSVDPKLAITIPSNWNRFAPVVVKGRHHTRAVNRLCWGQSDSFRSS